MAVHSESLPLLKSQKPMWSELPSELTVEIIGYVADNDEDYILLRQVAKSFLVPHKLLQRDLRIHTFVRSITLLQWATDNWLPSQDGIVFKLPLLAIIGVRRFARRLLEKGILMS